MRYGFKPVAAYSELIKSPQEFEHVRGVVEHELRQPECGSYVFLQPLQGDKTALTVFEG